MTRQTDFWKPKPYDFEAIVAGVDISVLRWTHVYRAAAHVSGKINTVEIKCVGLWNSIQNAHDNEDYLHFMRAGLGRSLDTWDNRRKGAKQ